ncbi:MAG: aminotransferase, partial [Pseudomonadales bacterium]
MAKPTDSKASLKALSQAHEKFRKENLKLDLTRGKPSSQQLDLADGLDGILGGAYLLQDGTDVRNYGGILGIPEARALGGELLGVPGSNVMAGGNSSLTLMYQYVAMMIRAWRPTGTEAVKFICLVPGYDRHFTICEHFDMEMIALPFLPTGPDMA